MNATLPPLPAPAIEASPEFAELGGTFGALFTLDQLRAYGAACAAAEREACANECERRHANGNRAHTHADECAAAIRARKDTE